MPHRPDADTADDLLKPSFADRAPSLPTSLSAEAHTSMPFAIAISRVSASERAAHARTAARRSLIGQTERVMRVKQRRLLLKS